MISGRVLRKMLQNSLNTASRSDDGDDDEDELGSDQFVEGYVVELRAGHGSQRRPWIKHVGRTQHRDSGSTTTTWMATLLDTLHFRLVDHNDISLSHTRRPPSHCLVYVLDSDLQPACPTSGSCFKQETGSELPMSVVRQSEDVVETPTLRNLPDLTLSSSTSRRNVGNSRRRHKPRDQPNVTSGGTSPPPIPPKPVCLQSLPLVARYPLRRKTLTATSTSPAMTMTSSMSSGVNQPTWPPTTTEPPPPPLPARRAKPPTPRLRVHLEPSMTSLSPTDPCSQPTAVNVDEQQHVSETLNDEIDDAEDELNYTVDVCGTSLLDCVLQAANSLSRGFDVRADDDDDDDAMLQQQLADDSINVDNDDNEPGTPSIDRVNSLDVVNSNSNFEVTACCIRSTV